jgi:MFS transporter, DHA2 family, multidrug resistance protein
MRPWLELAMSRIADARPQTAATVSTWVGFATMCLGMFMAILDVQVVATSLPTIQGALSIAPDQMSWIQTAYLIAEVIAIPLAGFLTRTLSMRWLFVGAVVLFTLASMGCAASGSFQALISWRVLQGFAGGTLIPSVFSAVFILFPPARQGIATTIGGVLAVLAPTIGPVVGGWITQAYSWHWLFLINVIPGLLAAVVATVTVPSASLALANLRKLDIVSLVLLALALTCLEIGLKQAPHDGWFGAVPLTLLALSVASAVAFALRTLRNPSPLVELRNFSDRSFVIGCMLSFVLGVGLFGSVYLMPVYLAFVRGHNALQIGTIMLVTGLAQLLTAPLAVWLEQKVEPRLLTAAGFALFAVGLAMSAFQTPQTGFAGMFWPQVIRGAAIMFCLLPPIRLALGNLEKSRVADASGLFNLMRNLGGAIGIALVDTIIYVRAPIEGARLLDRLQAGDPDVAAFVGVPDAMIAHLTGPPDPGALAMLRPLVETAAFTQAINEAWGMIALATVAALLCIPFAKGSLKESYSAINPNQATAR